MCIVLIPSVLAIANELIQEQSAPRHIGSSIKPPIREHKGLKISLIILEVCVGPHALNGIRLAPNRVSLLLLKVISYPAPGAEFFPNYKKRLGAG